MTTVLPDSYTSYDYTNIARADIIYDIENYEEAYIDCEKQNGNYYLGSCVYTRETGAIQLSTAISVDALFKYNICAIQLYLEEYDMHRGSMSSVHIMQLDIKPDGEYCAIIKTFWLKIIQRAWKTQFAKRKTAIRMRGRIQSQYYFMIHGRYPEGLTHIPGIRGLLRQFTSADAGGRNSERNEHRCSRFIIEG